MTTKNKNKVKQITRVAVVVDRSGSMNTIRDAAASGLDEQLKTLKTTASDSDGTYVTLVRFDHEVEVLYDGKNAKIIKENTGSEVVQPRGMTAMNDAVWKAIDLLEAKRKTSGTAYLVVVISDGYENSSEISSSTLAERIKKLESTGKWTFTYMLSNQDIKAVSQTLGLNRGNVASFISTISDTRLAFESMANATGHYMAQRRAGGMSVNSFYSSVAPDRTVDDVDVVNAPK